MDWSFSGSQALVQSPGFDMFRPIILCVLETPKNTIDRDNHWIIMGYYTPTDQAGNIKQLRHREMNAVVPSEMIRATL
jgi:hypothetical protein